MKKVIIKFDGCEYRVPGPKGNEAQAYYTDDRQDAIDTAHLQFKGESIEVKIKRVSEF